MRYELELGVDPTAIVPHSDVVARMRRKIEDLQA